uniref:Galactosylgalactosylxylosylprotein 3-beta-glucuronosyltransferase n=2 Tax=Caenorhabditis tropicalis TaxID=1561998 RepID=A0A1I7TU61_9PELO
MANTLSHISNIYWIVIEDSVSIVPAVHRILRRSSIPFTYMAYPSPENYPNRGWFQRTMALKYIRKKYRRKGNGVVYFGDDDNTYDLRLFNKYIRKVNKIGMWGVGHVGGSLVESPKVINQKVVGFNAEWKPNRYFAIDMAGFAVHLRVILNSDAVFSGSCPSGAGALESCLLEDLGLRREDVEPFGFEKKEEKEVLVWHTKTVVPDVWDLRRNFWKREKTPKTNGYFVEY